MPKIIPKFDEKSEESYLNEFSVFRQSLFSKIEQIYKKIISDEDQRLEIIVQNIKKNQPKKILEIGSGTLPIYTFLPDLLKKECEYHICETNPKKARYIKEKNKNVKVLCCDALNLPYQNNFFDFVFSKGVLHHIDDAMAQKRKQKRIDFLKEIKRTIKQGGVSFLMDFDHNPKCSKDVFWHYLHKVILMEGEHNFSNRTEVKGLFNLIKYRKIETGSFDTFKGEYYYIIGKK